MEEHLLSTGNIPDDVITAWDIRAFLIAERDGFPRPINPSTGSCWWQADGRHYIGSDGVERYVLLGQ